MTFAVLAVVLGAQLIWIMAVALVQVAIWAILACVTLGRHLWIGGLLLIVDLGHYARKRGWL